jgi:hypothetical protein
MNKAFVREAEDDTAPKCPRCHAIGLPVGPHTLAVHLPENAGSALAGSSVNFCPNPTCDVAYFDANHQVAPVTLLRSRAWPKFDDLSAVLCPCLQVSAAEIVGDAQRGDPTRIRQMLSAAQSQPHRCTTARPDARPCSAEAQRLYLKNLARG